MNCVNIYFFPLGISLSGFLSHDGVDYLCERVCISVYVGWQLSGVHISRAVGIGGTGGAISLPNFGRSVNPSLIRLCPLHYHPGFQTFLRFCTYRHKRKGTLQESKCLCLALQWGNWIRTSCSLVRTKQEFLCHPEVVAWELRMFGIPFGNTSTTIVQLAIAFLASSSCTILEFSATEAAAARSQKQRP